MSGGCHRKMAARRCNFIQKSRSYRKSLPSIIALRFHVDQPMPQHVHKTHVGEASSGTVGREMKLNVINGAGI